MWQRKEQTVIVIVRRSRSRSRSLSQENNQSSYRQAAEEAKIRSLRHPFSGERQGQQGRRGRNQHAKEDSAGRVARSHQAFQPEMEQEQCCGKTVMCARNQNSRSLCLQGMGLQQIQRRRVRGRSG